MSKPMTIKKFPQVDHAEADGELRDVYEDIHGTLRLPWVAFAIRVMSQFPVFVPRAWQALKPSIATRYAERGADLVRQAALLPGPPPPNLTPKLRANGWTDAQLARLHADLDALNYGNPKYAMLITAWNEAWHGRNAGGSGTLTGTDADLLPYGMPPGVDKFHLVDPDTASPGVQTSLKRVRDAFLQHGPASDYRVLAAYPDFLEMAIADVLEPVALTPEFDATSHRLRAIAREHVKGFPTPGGVSWHELTEELTPEQIAGLTGLLFMYNRFIPDVTIAVIRLKAALAGNEAATRNAFAV